MIDWADHMRFPLRDETAKSPFIHSDMEAPAVTSRRCGLSEDPGSLSLGGTSFDVQKTKFAHARIVIRYFNDRYETCLHYWKNHVSF